MRVNRKTKDLITKIMSVVLVIATVVGIGALVSHFVSNKADDNGRVEVNLSYEIGGLTAYGKYEETKESIYTKEAFKCDGLYIEPEFDSTITYQVFFYDSLGNFVSSTASLEGYYTETIPAGSSYARIVITPKWDKGTAADDKKINIFQINKYAKQLNVKVIKEQGEYVTEFVEVSLSDATNFTLDSGCYYGKDGKRVELSNYTSYIFVASNSCEFYMESTAGSVQYVIIRTDGSVVRYQKADGTWVAGEENTFKLNAGDKVAISTTDKDTNNIHFYLGVYVLK